MLVDRPLWRCLLLLYAAGVVTSREFAGDVDDFGSGQTNVDDHDQLHVEGSGHFDDEDYDDDEFTVELTNGKDDFVFDDQDDENVMYEYDNDIYEEEEEYDLDNEIDKEKKSSHEEIDEKSDENAILNADQVEDEDEKFASSSMFTLLELLFLSASITFSVALLVSVVCLCRLRRRRLDEKRKMGRQEAIWATLITQENKNEKPIVKNSYMRVPIQPVLVDETKGSKSYMCQEPLLK